MTGSEAEFWKEEMQKELDSIYENKVWTLVDADYATVEGSEYVSCRWVYSIKENNGKVLYKARLVARGFSQEEDNGSVYSPVAKHTTLRTLTCVANQFNMKISIMDIRTAFLYGRLDPNEKVYMQQPPGFEVKGKICELSGAIYGLRKSSKQWNICINNFLLSQNFKRSKNDFCLYTRITENSKFYILLYVDDIFIVFNNYDELLDLKKKLIQQFKFPELSNANKFLGINFTWNQDERTVYLS